MDNKDLEKFAKNDAYIQLTEENNHVFEGVYNGNFLEDDPFTPGDQRMVYKFTCADGKLRALTSKSKRLARKFLNSGANSGDVVKVERTGVGFNTSYRVDVITRKEPSIPSQPDGDVPF
ncbi:MAG: hypothetical protein PHE73_09275 [Sulfurovaceae bacterium]|nr:hypothetical protein [Sulfurovaceae bacterium]